MKRCGFLKFAPVAVAAGYVAPASATSHLIADIVQENPKLLALGEKLSGVEQAYQVARKASSDMWKVWGPQWPLAPEACCNKYSPFSSTGERDMERGLSGAGLVCEGESRPWYLKTAAEMERDIEGARKMLAKDDKRKRSYGKRFRQYRHDEIATAELGLALLPAYLAERDRVTRGSRYDEVSKAREEARLALYARPRDPDGAFPHFGRYHDQGSCWRGAWPDAILRRIYRSG